MAQLYLSLRVISPLTMRSDHATKGSRTARIISGSTLLGSLAAAHRLYYINEAEKAKNFARFFLNGEIYYPHLYPASFSQKESIGREIQEAHLPVYPVPKTARTCKRHPGFLSEENDDQHGVYDELLDWAVFKLSGRSAVDAFAQHQRCPHCNGVIDHVKEDYRYYRRARFASLPYNRVSAQVRTRLQTRTGINRNWDIVQEGILYNREIVEEGIRFWGTVKLPDDLVSPFTTFIKDVNDAGLIRIGTGRTRGMGQVNLTTHEFKDDEEGRESIRFDNFRERTLMFDDHLRKRIEGIGIKDPAPFYFAMVLHSPVILRDPLLRYYGTVDEKILAELVHLPSSIFRQIHEVASIERVIGWNELWGTPRTQEYAIDTGSVFLFATSSDPNDSLVQSLFELEEKGVGRRRSEGFGRVCISDQFHIEGGVE